MTWWTDAIKNLKIIYTQSHFPALPKSKLWLITKEKMVRVDFYPSTILGFNEICYFPFEKALTFGRLNCDVTSCE